MDQLIGYEGDTVSLMIPSVMEMTKIKQIYCSHHRIKEKSP